MVVGAAQVLDRPAYAAIYRCISNKIDAVEPAPHPRGVVSIFVRGVQE